MRSDMIFLSSEVNSEADLAFAETHSSEMIQRAISRSRSVPLTTNPMFTMTIPDDWKDLSSNQSTGTVTMTFCPTGRARGF